jgi:hypothetical protein
MHTAAKTVSGPLTHVPFAELCPGNEALAELMSDYR